MIQDDGTQNYLVLQPIYPCFKDIGNNDYISTLKKKYSLSDKSIKPPAKSNDSLAPTLSYINPKTQIKFDGSCLKQHKVIFIHKQLMNIYISLNHTGLLK